jgi:hypothetical protein
MHALDCELSTSLESQSFHTAAKVHPSRPFARHRPPSRLGTTLAAVWHQPHFREFSCWAVAPVDISVVRGAAPVGRGHTFPDDARFPWLQSTVTKTSGCSDEHQAQRHPQSRWHLGQGSTLVCALRNLTGLTWGGHGCICSIDRLGRL